jgi:alginate O-acetyltransferase complex protein AlgI
MVFSSYLFLFAFLPACLLTYLLTPLRWKNLLLLLWSWLFYAWGAPRFFPIFLLSCAADYGLGLAMGAARTQPRRRALLVLALVVNLSALLYFKYANFFVGEFNRLLAVFDLPQLPWAAVILPIGISFLTFQKISFVVDVYRGTVEPARAS